MVIKFEEGWGTGLEMVLEIEFTRFELK